jgi:DNA-binding transcriptional LysR family regulator
LGVAQSTVSETLLSLERLLGTPVTLRRAGREATLTAAAEAMIPHARSLIAVSEAALAVAGQDRTPIRLGTVESISSFLLPGPLSAFRALWPRIDVRITVGLCQDLRKRVEKCELDAALTVESADKDGLNALAPVRLRLIASPSHPLADQVVAGRDLRKWTFLLSDSEGAFNDLMQYWLGSVGDLPRLESAGSIEGVKRGIRNSDAIGVLPDYAVAEELSAGSLVALRSEEPPPAISLRLTASTALQPGSPLEALAGQIRKVLVG